MDEEEGLSLSLPHRPGGFDSHHHSQQIQKWFPSQRPVRYTRTHTHTPIVTNTHTHTHTHTLGVFNHGTMPGNCNVISHSRHMSNEYRLRFEEADGAGIVRAQEKHQLLLQGLLHRYCPPKKRALDGCAGSFSIMLAMITLGIPGMASDIDKVAVDLGTNRARHYLDYLCLQEGAYPAHTFRRMLKTDNKDPYAWYHKADLVRGPKAVATDVLVIPSTTAPFGIPDFRKALEEYNGQLFHNGLEVKAGEGGVYQVVSTVDRRKGEEIPYGLWGSIVQRLAKDSVGGHVIEVISPSLSLFLVLPPCLCLYI